MRKTVFLFLPFLFITVFSYAQDFEWSTSGGYVGITNSYSGAHDIARDPSGNIYLFNDANLAQQCQGDTVNMLSPSNPIHSFIYKFNSSGALQWAKAIGVYFTPYAIEVDEAGSVYVLGQTPSDSIKTADTVFACQSAAYYIVKLNSQGKFVWSKFTMPAIFGGGLGINALKYHSGKIYYQSAALQVSSMDTTGQVLNSLSAPFYSPQTAQPGIMFKNAASFSNGDLLFVGQHRGRLTFGTDTLPLTNQEASLDRYFYIRTTPTLQLVWYKSFGSFMNKYREPIGLCIDPNDNIYSSGSLTFGFPVYFGPDSVGNFTLGNGTSSFFKIDGNGNPIWIRDVQAGQSSTPYGLVWADDNSGVYASGVYSGATSFGNFTLNGNNDGKGYLVKLDSDGNFTDAFSSAKPSVLPNALQAYPLALASNGSGKYYVSGMLNTLTSYEQSCTNYIPNRGFFLSQFTGIKDTVAKPAIDVLQEGRQVFFNIQLQPGTQFVSWNFGDGASTTIQQNPVHTYTGPGYFPAVLTTKRACLTRKDTVFMLYEGIQKITPNRTANIGYFIGHIEGGFPAGSATVKLIRNGNALVADTAIVGGPGRISAHFIFDNITTGLYDVVVNIGAFTDTLKNGLLVEQPNNIAPTLHVSGFSPKLWKAYYPENIVVTNNANISQIALPVYISFEGRMPTNVLVKNTVEHDSVTALYRDTLGSEFILTVDSITGDSSYFAAFIIPVLEPGESCNIALYTRYNHLGKANIRAYLGKPLFSELELIDLGLRSNCEFLPVCIQCVHDILGLIPAAGCAAGSLNIGCDLGDLVRRQFRRSFPGSSGPSHFTLSQDLKSLGMSILGAALSCGGEEALAEVAKATTSTVKSIAASALPLANQLNDIQGAFGSCVGYTPLGSTSACRPTEIDDWTTFIVNNLDPNLKNGPTGLTPDNYVNNREYMSYQIHFENVDTAQAAVREVVVRDTLDLTKLDINTFQFTGYGFSDTVYLFFERDTVFTNEIDLRPDKNTKLRVLGKLNKINGALEWRFSSYDTANYALTNIVSDGFLNPNDSAPEGEGFVTYMIKPRAGLAHGSIIQNKAIIYFDYNDPIETPVWVNTIDDVKPQSSVSALPAIVTDTVFTVSWSGIDNHAGILTYDVFVTINDTLSGQFLHNVRDTSIQLTGSYGSTYKFWTVARDRVGNIEDAPAQPDAVVTLQAPVSVNELKDVSVNLVPNPATETVSIIFSEPVAEETELTVTGINGKVELKTTMQAGESRKTIHLTNIAAGVHLVTLKNTRQSVVKMFVRQ